MLDKELMVNQESNLPTIPDWAGAMCEQMGQSLRVMAEAIKATNESMEMLKRQMQQMVPLTRGQANALNKQIRERAIDLREQYCLSQQADASIATAIRKDVKLAAGTRSIDELPRALYGVYSDQVAMWDSYPVLKGIKQRYRGVKSNEP
ncbi:MAG: hypothetical protein RR301_08050 [Clostridia bacterium]